MGDGKPQPFSAQAVNNGLRALAFAIFHQAVVEAIVEEREKAQGVHRGDPGAPGSWEGLEKVLGKEAVDRMRKGS